MKKKLIVLGLILSIFMVACDSDTTSTLAETTELETTVDLIQDIEEAFIAMDELESFRVNAYLTNVPVFLVDWEIVYRYDALMASQDLSSSMTYYEEVNGAYYQYVQEDTSWVLETETTALGYPMWEFFDYNDFELVDGEWVWSVASEFFDETETDYITNALITLENGYIKTLEYDAVNADNHTMNIHMTFLEYDQVEVTLPSE